MGKALERNGVLPIRFFDVDPKKIGGKVQGKIPVLSWKELPSLKHEGVVLAAVGAKGARARFDKPYPRLE